MGTHYRVTMPILSILRSTISTACHLAPVERLVELSSGHIGIRAHMSNSLLELLCFGNATLICNSFQ